MPLFACGITAEVRPCIPITADTAAGKLANKCTACLSSLRTAEGLRGFQWTPSLSVLWTGPYTGILLRLLLVAREVREWCPHIAGTAALLLGKMCKIIDEIIDTGPFVSDWKEVKVDTWILARERLEVTRFSSSFLSVCFSLLFCFCLLWETVNFLLALAAKGRRAEWIRRLDFSPLSFHLAHNHKTFVRSQDVGFLLN